MLTVQIVMVTFNVCIYITSLGGFNRVNFRVFPSASRHSLACGKYTSRHVVVVVLVTLPIFPVDHAIIIRDRRDCVLPRRALSMCINR